MTAYEKLLILASLVFFFWALNRAFRKAGEAAGKALKKTGEALQNKDVQDGIKEGIKTGIEIWWNNRR